MLFRSPVRVAIGIENGIVLGADGLWYDIAAVCVLSPSGISFTAWSAAVPFPELAVNEALKDITGGTTVGSVIAEATGCDPADPHRELTNGAVTRSSLLAQALSIAFGALIKDGDA